MDNFLAEGDYTNVFANQGVYFLDAINNRNWGNLLHSEDFYIPYLVQEFYNSLNSSHVNFENHTIIINCRGE